MRSCLFMCSILQQTPLFNLHTVVLLLHLAQHFITKRVDRENVLVVRPVHAVHRTLDIRDKPLCLTPSSNSHSLRQILLRQEVKVLCHPNGGNAHHTNQLRLAIHDELGNLLLTPHSRGNRLSGGHGLAALFVLGQDQLQPDQRVMRDLGQLAQHGR